MKSSALFAATVSLALAASPAAADQTVYCWNNLGGGAWTTVANWVMEDGSPAASYPHVAGDVAVFNGLNAKKAVSVAASAVIDIDELRLDDGCTTFGIVQKAHLHADRFARAETAVVYFYNSGGYNHASVSDTWFGNRDEVLFNGGFLPGAMVNKDSSTWGNPRSATIDGDGLLKFATLDSPNMAYSVKADTTWSKDVSFIYGNYGSGRHVTFDKECTLTIPCGQISQLNPNCHFGNPNSAVQGTVATGGRPILFWPFHSTATSFRTKVDAPMFVQCGPGTTLFCDDHASENNAFRVASGTLMLGSVQPDGAAASVTNSCVLGTGPVSVAWSGTLDVAAENALENAECLQMTSYRGFGETWGSIVMRADSTVECLYLDGKMQKRGTYGATGSGATHVNDKLFSGTGLLTVRKGCDFTLVVVR